MDSAASEIAFPSLTPAEIALIEKDGIRRVVADGTVVFRAGSSNIDLFIVEDGELEILNPNENNLRVAVHTKGHFAGDIDLLTGRPVVVSAVARGETHLLQIPGAKVREILLRIPQISEKLLKAFQERRALLASHGNVGLKLYGPAECKDTNLIREFLDKNFVPYTWMRDESMNRPGSTNGHDCPSNHGPVVDCGDGKILNQPSLQELARCAGVWQECPVDTVDLAIVGAGPAGMSAAVYAASEGISTLVLDGLGPGGQAASSSKIENFIGFPSGLSGTELATRAVIQMLKFGARIVAPVHVQRLEKASEPGGPLLLHLDCGSVVKARNVLIASGLAWRHLDALGSIRYEHVGIYYSCTATETAAHQGDQVAVVGAGNSAGQAAMYLAEQCAKSVHILMRGDDLAASMSTYLIERINATPNITVHRNVEITNIIEDGRLRGVELKSSNVPPYSIEVAALFVFIGAEPRANWLPAEVARDAKGYLLTGGDAAASGDWPLTDRAPCALETTIPNLFAAGDIRSSSAKRVGFAVGDGALAVACVHTLRTTVRA
jgi:thioredoxin reductase (NADPH)